MLLRKGAHLHSWTTKDEQYLRNNAGLIPADKIGKHLGRSTKSVRRKAESMGLSLRCFKSELKWCPSCAKMRASVSPVTGICRVCSKQHNKEEGEWRVSKALEQLTQEERIEYARQEARRGRRHMPPKPVKRVINPKHRYLYTKEEDRYAREVELWEIRCLDLDINANKTRLKRIREKLGTNPRKGGNE